MSIYRKLSDEELLEKLSQSDQKAFNEIYKRYWDSLYKAAYSILKDHDGCMDVLQDVFIWLWKNHTRLSIRKLRPYLLTAVKFKVANYIRDGKIRSSFFEQIQHIKEPQTFAEDSLEVKELQQIIGEFTRNLPEKCRRVFLLSRQEHFSNKQIAEHLDISVKTVENQITIALKKLRGSLSRMFYFFLF